MNHPRWKLGNGVELSSFLTRDLKERRLVADLMLTDCLFQTAGVAIEKVVKHLRWKRSVGVEDEMS